MKFSIFYIHPKNRSFSMFKKPSIESVIQPKGLKELSDNGVSITYDESAHAKLLVVDRRVGIASSMNYYAGSSGGALWEAGLVTTQEINVQSITESILKKT